MSLESIYFKSENVKDFIDVMLGKIDAGPLGNNPNTIVSLRSDAMAELMLSQLVRDVSLKIRDEKISNQVLGTGRSMMKSALPGLAQGWEDGDDICPAYFFHRGLTIPTPFPFPHPNPTGPYPWSSWFSFESEINRTFNTQTLSPVKGVFEKIGSTGKEIFIAETLRQLSSLTVSKEFNLQLKSSAIQLMKSAASSAACDDFENICGSTGPRRPFPHRILSTNSNIKNEFSKYAQEAH